MNNMSKEHSLVYGYNEIYAVRGFSYLTLADIQTIYDAGYAAIADGDNRIVYIVKDSKVREILNEL